MSWDLFMNYLFENSPLQRPSNTQGNCCILKLFCGWSPWQKWKFFWKCPNGFCLFVCFSPYEYQSVKKEVSFVEIYISACVFWMLGREYMNIKGYSDLATRKGRNIFLLKENVIKYVILTAFVITSYDILCWLGIIRLRNKKHILLFLWPVFSEGLLVYQFCHLCYVYVC